MMRSIRLHGARLLSGVVAASLLGLALPDAAAADPAHRQRGAHARHGDRKANHRVEHGDRHVVGHRFEHGDRHVVGHRFEHGDRRLGHRFAHRGGPAGPGARHRGRGHGWGPPVVVHGSHCRAQAAPHGRHAHRQQVYTCRPCGHRFHARDLFHRHLTHHHHVPRWNLPFVIVHSAFGWVFYG